MDPQCRATAFCAPAEASGVQPRFGPRVISAQMGWFSADKQRCDWCGLQYEGSGVSDGEMTMCGPECVEQRNAPPVAPQARPDRRAARALTAAIAHSELEIAGTECGFYEQLIARAMAASSSEELVAATQRAHQTYVDFWEHLDLVRSYLLGRKVSTADYDAIRAVSLWRSDQVTSKTDVRLSGSVRVTYTATFHPENIHKARHALHSLHAACRAAGPD